MATLSRKLKTAIHFDDIKEVKKLLKSSPMKQLRKNPFLFGGYGLLKLAIGLKKREISKLLINKGVRINRKYCVKTSDPLHLAIDQRFSDVVELLIEKGADVNTPIWGNLTPLQRITYIMNKPENLSANFSIMKCLLRNGADTEAKATNTDWAGDTVLHIACIYKNLRQIKLLIKHNANVNTKNDNNSYPISETVLYCGLRATKLLLGNGARVNCTLGDKFDPELEAAIGTNLERIKLLENAILLHVAIEYDNLKMVKLLIDYGADIHYLARFKQKTPLMLTIETFNSEIFDLLLNKGAKIDDRDEYHFLPLHYTVYNIGSFDERDRLRIVENDSDDRIKIIKSLIKAGANVNEVPQYPGDDFTFLMMAVIHGQFEVIDDLCSTLILDTSLINYNTLQASKYNNSLLSQEEIDDREFMEKIESRYQTTEKTLIKYILTRYYLNAPVEDKLIESIRSGPVNTSWDKSAYFSFIKNLEDDLQKQTQSLKDHKVGDTNIALWDLLSAPWKRLVNHANDKNVRKLCIDNYFKNDKSNPHINILKKRLQAAVKRSQLLEKAREITFVMLKSLPFLCSEEILSYLDDEDLETLNNEFMYIVVVKI